MVSKEGGPIGPAAGDQPPGDVGAEHRHLALGEIEVVGGLVDHDHRERHQRVDAADRDPGQQLLQEQVHLAPAFLHPSRPQPRAPRTPPAPARCPRSPGPIVEARSDRPGCGPDRPPIRRPAAFAVTAAASRWHRCGAPPSPPRPRAVTAAAPRLLCCGAPPSRRRLCAVVAASLPHHRRGAAPSAPRLCTVTAAALRDDRRSASSSSRALHSHRGGSPQSCRGALCCHRPSAPLSPKPLGFPGACCGRPRFTADRRSEIRKGRSSLAVKLSSSPCDHRPHVEGPCDRGNPYTAQIRASTDSQGPMDQPKKALPGNR